MSLEDKLISIKSAIEAIRNKIIDKGVAMASTVPLANYPNYINMIESQPINIEEEWTPDPEWWDIEAIFNDSSYDYAGGNYALGETPEGVNLYKKVVVLLDSRYDSTLLDPFVQFYLQTASSGSYANAVYTSDGQFYKATSSGNVTHYWDTSQDKLNSTGEYKTRFMIFYIAASNNSNINLSSFFNNFITTLAIIGIVTNQRFSLDASVTSGYQGLKFFKGFGNGALTNSSKYNFALGELELYSVETPDSSNNYEFCPLYYNHIKQLKIKELETFYLPYSSTNTGALPCLDLSEVDFSAAPSAIFSNGGLQPIKIKGTIDLSNNTNQTAFTLFKKINSFSETESVTHRYFTFSLNLPSNADVTLNPFLISEASLKYLVENAPELTESHTLYLRTKAATALAHLSNEYRITYNGNEYTNGVTVLNLKGWTVDTVDTV